MTRRIGRCFLACRSLHLGPVNSRAARVCHRAIHAHAIGTWLLCARKQGNAKADNQQKAQISSKRSASNFKMYKAHDFKLDPTMQARRHSSSERADCSGRTNSCRKARGSRRQQLSVVSKVSGSGVFAAIANSGALGHFSRPVNASASEANFLPQKG